MSRFPTRCKERGCPNRTTDGYCEQHRHASDRQKPRPWHAWYSWAHWSKVKDAFRSKYPMRAVICQHKDSNGVQCNRPATEIDHVIPHKGNWDLFVGGVDYSNLQGLCHAHHSEKTAREDCGFGNEAA